MKKIAVINGPNLNLLGQREIGIYGSISLEDIRRGLEESFIEVMPGNRGRGDPGRS